MTSANIGDAVVGPQDKGTGTSANDDPNSAALVALAGSHEQGTYVPVDGGLDFQNVDQANSEVDVGKGYCYIEDDITTSAGSRANGGRPQVQSTAGGGASHDTALPNGTDQAQNPYTVILPSDQTNLALATSAVNDVFISVDPENQNDVFIHHGSGISEPSNPSIKLGTVDTSDGSTTRENDLPSPKYDDAEVNGNLTANSAVDVSGILTTDKHQEWQEVSTPTSGADSGFNQIYFKPGGKLFRQDASGNEKRVGGGGVDVENNGTSLVTSTSGINFNTDVSAIDDGDGTVTVNNHSTAESVRSRGNGISGNFALPQDGGASGKVFDMDVTASATSGTEMSYSFGVDGTDVFKVVGDADGSGGTSGRRVQTVSGAIFSNVVDSPHSFQVTLLEHNESTEKVVPARDGETLTIHRWGVYKLSGQDAPTGLQVQLLDNSGIVQASANTTDEEDLSTAGIANLTNNSGAISFFKVRLNNQTSSNFTSEGVGGHVGYVVE